MKVFAFSEKFEGHYCGLCGGHTAQKPVGFGFVGTMACNYDEIRNSFSPHSGLSEFFAPTQHVNYENRVLDIPDSLPKYLDFPAPHGSGRTF